MIFTKKDFKKIGLSEEGGKAITRVMYRGGKLVKEGTTKLLWYPFIREDDVRDVEKFLEKFCKEKGKFFVFLRALVVNLETWPANSVHKYQHRIDLACREPYWRELRARLNHFLPQVNMLEYFIWDFGKSFCDNFLQKHEQKPLSFVNRKILEKYFGSKILRACPEKDRIGIHVGKMYQILRENGLSADMELLVSKFPRELRSKCPTEALITEQKGYFVIDRGIVSNEYTLLSGYEMPETCRIAMTGACLMLTNPILYTHWTEFLEKVRKVGPQALPTKWAKFPS